MVLGDDKQSVVLVIAAAGTIGLFAHDWYAGKRLYSIHKWTLVAWLGLFVCLFISTLTSLSVGFSVWEIIKYIVAFLLFVYFSNKKAPHLYTRLLEDMALASIALLVVSYAFELSPLLQSMIPKMNLLYKSYGHSHVVNLLVFTLPYFIWQAKKTKSIPSVLALAFISVGFVTSYARGAFALLVLIAAAVAYRYGMTDHHSKGNKPRSQTAIAIVVLLGVFFATSAGMSWLQRNTTSQTTQKTSIFESRVGYWKQAALSIRDRPLFGQGPGTFFLVSKKYQDEQNRYSWFAHSYPAQIAVELGLIGLIFPAILLYFTLWKNLRFIMVKNETDWKRQALIFGAAITLLYSFIEMNLDFTVVWVVFWIFLGSVNQIQEQPENERKEYVVVSTSTPLCILGLFYFSAVAAAALQLREDGIKKAIILAPHDAGIAKKYLDYISNTESAPNTIINAIYFFHNHNSEVLAKLAKIHPDADSYTYYMHKAVQNDPRNRLLIESYVSEISKKNIPARIHDVARLLIANISINKQTDGRYLDTNWNNVRECFNKSTLVWADPPYTDTYEAKSLYFASLCLLKSKKINEAKELLKIAVNSRPAWSNIYIDYAAVVWWNGKDKLEAEKSINLCKENMNARDHCSQFEHNTFQQTSIYDPSVVLIQ